jgi:hypothetical protein
MKTLDVCENFPPLLASRVPPSYPLLASALFLRRLVRSLRCRRPCAPSGGAHELPRRRRPRRSLSPAPMRPPAGGPLPGGRTCADLCGHSVAVPARPPAGWAPRRRRCYRPRCDAGDEEAHPGGWLLSRLPGPRRTAQTPRPRRTSTEVVS